MSKHFRSFTPIGSGTKGFWLFPLMAASLLALVQLAGYRALGAEADLPLDVASRGLPEEPVRGLYVNAWAAGSPARRAGLLAFARENGLNTAVIDVMEVGVLSWESEIPLAREIGAARRIIANPAAVVQEFREAGLRPVARIVLFRDPLLADARPDLAVRDAVSGGSWIDRAGHRWVDPTHPEVLEYKIRVAEEAIRFGFEEIQLDYVRFPDAPAALLRQAVYRYKGERSRREVVRDVILAFRDRADGVPVSADVFGLVASASGDLGIGQHWETIEAVVDAILPMTYPSHYAAGTWGMPRPAAEPRRVVARAMADAVRRTETARIIPWIQDFTLGEPRYGTHEVVEQIRGAADAGVFEWILWNPGSRYSPGILEAAGGRWFDHDRLLP